MTKLIQDIETIKSRGGDPTKYRQGLAGLYGVAVEIVDGLIAGSTTTIRQSDEESIAQERMADERAEARRHPKAARAWNHEEE